MSDIKYDSAKLEADSEKYLASFKSKMKKISEECIGELYVNCLPYIETDSWTNYREALRLELSHEYKYSTFKDEWAKNLRRAIFVENREELAQLISKDILDRNKVLEDTIKEYPMFRYSL